ncbi:MAG: hypothetical protein ABSH05_08175 [Bryobacteraceae bacterium]|jgi:hypothetical protein
MSLRDTLRETGDRLQQAIAARRYPKAEALLRQYRRCLETLRPDAPDRAEVLREAARFFESARRMALAGRAAAAAQLAALPASRAPYRVPQMPARHTWEMTG